MDFPEDVVDTMTQNCLRRQEWLQRRAAEIVNGKLKDIAEDDQKIKLRLMNKSNFPYATRGVQSKLLKNKLTSDCEFNEKVFYSRKVYRHDFEKKEEQALKKSKVSPQYNKVDIKFKHDKADESKRFGFLEDKDIIRLQSVKDVVFPVYNYDLLIKKMNSNRIGSDCLDFHEQSTYENVK